MSLNQLLTQLGDVERQGLVMFRKIEESFKHPYSQQEAITDTANILTQLDAMMALAKNEGFGALTLLPTSSIMAASTPSASSVTGGTPKPTFMSPRMQNHVYSNSTLLNGNTNSNTSTQNAIGENGAAASGAASASAASMTPGDVSMLSPPPFSIGTPSAITAPQTGTASTTTPGPTSSIGSPHVMDVAMTTPSASGPDAAAATPSSSMDLSGAPTATPAQVLAQMMEARQKDVQALYSEKAKLKTRFKVAATIVKT
ncbi:hypothetical protein BGZ94_007285 [Podila epigama]|nr:hypothetical protein BGZ94_007285 [Podila epigama]